MNQQPYDEMIKKALERYEDERRDHARFFVNKGDVFQIGVTHLENVSLGDLDAFCRRNGYKWEIVAEGIGIIII